MHAIVVHRNGGSEVLEYGERPTPEPGPGHILVEVAAAGLNFIEVYQREGRYPLPLPFTPGAEFAGTVAAVGAGVEGFAVGDAVGAVDAIGGSYAQFTLVAADRALHIPDGVSLETAAAALLQGLTAHYLTTSVWPVKAGETALVHAAAGGVGMLLTQLAKAKGARVIGTVSSERKEVQARGAGADEVIRYTEVDDLAGAVRGLTGGRGVHVVYDGVGASTFDASLASVRPRGMLALFGGASGPVPPFDPMRLSAAGSLVLTRPTLAHFIKEPDELAWRSAELLAAIASGSLQISIGAHFPLAEAAAAHDALTSRATTGKVVLIP